MNTDNMNGKYRTLLYLRVNTNIRKIVDADYELFIYICNNIPDDCPWYRYSQIADGVDYAFRKDIRIFERIDYKWITCKHLKILKKNRKYDYIIPDHLKSNSTNITDRILNIFKNKKSASNELEFQQSLSNNQTSLGDNNRSCNSTPLFKDNKLMRQQSNHELARMPLHQITMMPGHAVTNSLSRNNTITRNSTRGTRNTLSRDSLNAKDSDNTYLKFNKRPPNRQNIINNNIPIKHNPPKLPTSAIPKLPSWSAHGIPIDMSPPSNSFEFDFDDSFDEDVKQPANSIKPIASNRMPSPHIYENDDAF